MIKITQGTDKRFYLSYGGTPVGAKHGYPTHAAASAARARKS